MQNRRSVPGALRAGAPIEMVFEKDWGGGGIPNVGRARYCSGAVRRRLEKSRCHSGRAGERSRQAAKSGFGCCLAYQDQLNRAPRRRSERRRSARMRSIVPAAYRRWLDGIVFAPSCVGLQLMRMWAEILYP